MFKAEPEEQAVLVAADDFEREPDTGHHGWTVAWLGDDIELGRVDELIISSYRLVAPAEHVAQLDACCSV